MRGAAEGEALEQLLRLLVGDPAEVSAQVRAAHDDGSVIPRGVEAEIEVVAHRVLHAREHHIAGPQPVYEGDERLRRAKRRSLPYVSVWVCGVVGGEI